MSGTLKQMCEFNYTYFMRWWTNQDNSHPIVHRMDDTYNNVAHKQRDDKECMRPQ